MFVRQNEVIGFIGAGAIAGGIFWGKFNLLIDQYYQILRIYCLLRRPVNVLFAYTQVYLEKRSFKTKSFSVSSRFPIQGRRDVHYLHYKQLRFTKLIAVVID